MAKMDEEKVTSESSSDPRIQLILKMITDIASGKCKANARSEGKDNELDAVIHGLLMLSKELTAKEDERRQAEQKLRESRARLEDYATETSGWWWETDAKHRFTSFDGG